MLSFAAIIHASGVVLWSQALEQFQQTWTGDVCSYLQQYVLRTSATKTPVINGNQILSVTLPEANAVTLVAGVAVGLHLLGVEGLLRRILGAFIEHYDLNEPIFSDDYSTLPVTDDFTAVYEDLLGGVPTNVPDTVADTVAAPEQQQEAKEEEDDDTVLAALEARHARLKQMRQRKEPKARPAPVSTSKGNRVWEEDSMDASAIVDSGSGIRPIQLPIESDVAYTPQHKAGPSILTRLLASVNLGTRVLADTDLDAPLAALQQHLVSKNVPVGVANVLLSSVRRSLVGQSVGQIQPAVRRALGDAVRRILIPNNEINILFEAQTRQAEIARARGQGTPVPEPYKICFVGVNGVGKTTTLSKVALYLKSHGMNPLIAACDTFRSGAVEQLNTHSQRLGIPLYQAGYRRDAASVCRGAIGNAIDNNCDVVLIDTAGRMPTNNSHMSELGKLVSINHPDRILMVAEALVGNDSIEQMRGFNRALIDYAPGEERTVDAYVLTKFDTVGSKVGTALSLVTETGRPIVFVGVGQNYHDIEPLNVELVTDLLLSA